MAVIAARKKNHPVAGPVAPRARRTALMAASVPLLTRRTWSHPGTRLQISSASRTSRSVGAPNEVPSAAARCTASTTAGWACPRIDAP